MMPIVCSSAVDLGAELAEGFSQKSEDVLQEALHRAEAVHDPGGNPDADRDELGHDRGDAGEHLADACTGRRELVRVEAGHGLDAGASETEGLAELAQCLGEAKEDDLRAIDSIAEAVHQAAKEALDAEHDLEDPDREGLEALVLHAIEFLAHGTGEAALLEELAHGVGEELDALVGALEEGAEPADVAAYRDGEASRRGRQRTENEHRRQQRGGQRGHGDAEELDADDE